MNHPTPTNLIFFLSDNHTRRMLGAYGHPVVKTPNLDRLASMGTVFDNAYCASPVCCPARASLATGRFPHHTGYWDNTLVYDGKVPSWQHRLREQGHTVTSVGKLHYRSSDDDNGFSEEIIPMHIIEGQGALFGLLRATPQGERPRSSPRKSYEATGVGECDYILYDERITAHAIEWLREHAARRTKPWVLLVSYSSPHPPFTVPQRLMDLYDPAYMPLPARFQVGDQPQHPAISHLRRLHGYEGLASEAFVRRTVAGYCALTTFMDEQVGRVMGAAESLGLLANTRVLYTSDHGEAAGAHGLFGKCVMYEHSVGVPLIAAGPFIPQGRRVSQLVSHADLFPTIVRTVGAELARADEDLPGTSLWPALDGIETRRPMFAEYHAHGSRAAAFMLRRGRYKLVHHVDAPPQLFDLEADPHESVDLLQHGTHAELAPLEAELRRIVDPEAVDRRAKADQAARLQQAGGADRVLKRGSFGHNPIPGRAAHIEAFTNPLPGDSPCDS